MKKSLISLILLCSACGLSYAHLVTHTPTLDIFFVRPAAGAASGNLLNVAVIIGSTFEIKSVKANVEGREAELAFNGAVSCSKAGPVCTPGWVGNVSLSGLSRGQKTLTVSATDVFGNTSQAQRIFVYDQAPALNLAAPLAETVARPAIFVDATCADDDPAGCVSLTVRVNDEVTLGTGKDNVKGLLFLSAYDGRPVILSFTARDSIGQTTTLTREVFVESSINLSEVASVGGHILDAQSDRILFLEDNSLKIRNLASGLDTIVINDPAKPVAYGFLAPKGAIFVASSAPGFTLYDWRDGNLVNLGLPNSSSSLKVKGKYAIWNVSPPLGSDSLILRDLDSGTNTQVSTTANNTDNDVSASGDVVYFSRDSSTNTNVYRYRGGTNTKLTSSLENIYPLTDGINVVYLCFNQSYAIVLYGSAGEVTLSSSQGASPGRDYQLNGGWVAFTRSSNTTLQVWTRSPAGEEAQASFFSVPSSIKALSPLGGVIFNKINGNSYLKEANTPNNAPVDVGSNLGHYFWQDGQWLVTIGRSLFRVNTTPRPVPTLLTEASSQQGIALNAVTWVRSPFSTITTQNLSSDQRTRVVLLATNISLLPGDNTVITAQAEDSQHRLYSLPVEYVGKVPNFDWLTQINIMLPAELRGAGNVWVSIAVRGEVSNRMVINIQ